MSQWRRAAADIEPVEVDPRPFGLPARSIEIVLDLPFPPSVNHIWRRNGRTGRVYRSARYLCWIERANATVMAAKQFPRHKITGRFEAFIQLNEQAGTGDADNRVKCVLDWCQRQDVIGNDKDCRRLIVEWAAHNAAPAGCRITLRSLHG